MMIPHEFDKFAPIKIGAYYVVLLVIATTITIWSIGEDVILGSASKSKPFAFLLGDRDFPWKSFNKPLSDDTDSKLSVYFGDSTSFMPPDAWNANQANFDIHMPGLISGAVRKREEHPEVTFLEWAFQGASMFEYYCMFFKVKKYSPDLIIIPINWVFFGHIPHENGELSAFVPLWVDDLSADHENPVRLRGISVVKQLSHKISLYSLYPTGIKIWVSENLRSLPVVRALEGAPIEFAGNESRAITASEVSEANDGSKETEESPQQQMRAGFTPGNRRARRLIGSMKIPTSDTTYRSFCALAHLASKRKVKVLFFIWPLNKEDLKAVGRFDESEFRHSRKLFIEATEGEYTCFMDLSGLLEHRDFADFNSHCTVKGRRKIAEALAPKVLEILQDNSPAD